ncbi:MAG: hypothetical protein HYR67_15370 [Bacteroidetes bacterium]|nr:hypothetical protein [Bacteroidota bacterium]
METEKSPLTIFNTADNTDVIFAEFRANLEVDLSTARQIVANRLDFTGNKKHYLVLDMSNVRNVTAEAKKFLQQPEGGLKNILGAALIASNPVAALIANVFIKTPKNFQAKFFYNKQAALDWIYLKKQTGLSVI